MTYRSPARELERARWLVFRASCLACAAAGVAAPALADGRNRPGAFKPDKVAPLGSGAPINSAAGSGDPPDPFPELAGGPGSFRPPEPETAITGLPGLAGRVAENDRPPAVHILQPVINGVAQSGSVMAPIMDGKILLPEEFLNANGMVFEGETFSIGERRFVPAGSLRDADVGVELARGKLVIECGAGCYRHETMSAMDRLRGDMSPVATGGFVNYELFGEQGAVSDSVGAQFQAGVFSPLGTGQAYITCSSLREDDACVRLDTSWTVDDPDSLRRLTFGDAITNAETWGRPARFGGVSWGTDFALDPGFITYPLPALAGESVLPGTVDVLINDQKRFSGDVAPGPFSITDVPVISGAGTATVIVRDTLGRETAIDTAYYAAPQLLKKDLSSYSVETGFLRENYGLTSNEYGEAFVAGGYARGVSDTLTLGLRSEISADLQTGGLSAAMLNPAFGVSGGAVAVSSDNGESGMLTSLRHEYRSRRFTIGANVDYASKAYRGLGEVRPRPQVSSRAFVGLSFENLGHANLNWTYRDEWSGQSFSSLGLGWSVPVGRAVFNMSAFRTLEPSPEFFGAVRMSIPLGRGVSSGGAEYRRRRFGASASYHRSPKTDGGFGYDIAASSNEVDRLDAGLAHRSRIADVKVDYSSVDGADGVRGSIRGGVAAVGGRLHASRSVNNSMAVVKVGEQEGVKVYVDRQMSGRTGKDGKALLTNLRPFEDNEITFDPLDVGLEENIGEEAIMIRPGLRTGHVASFDVRRGVNMMLAVRREDGRFLPEGAVMRDMRLGTKYPVGAEGQVYIANAQNVSRLSFEMLDDRCVVDVVPPAQIASQPIMNGGQAVCRTFEGAARQ